MPAALAGLAAFVLYAVTLAPTTAFWDTSEYIATAHILGIPHPPGNPFFVVFAKSWSVLLAVTGLPVAVRVNLLAAATGAASVGVFFLVAHRVVLPILEEEGRALVGAGAAAMLGGTALTVWNQSNVNEKVYTISVLVIAVVTWLAIRWHDRRGEPGSERYLLVALFLMALGSTNHLMSVLPAPAFGVLLLLSGPAVLMRPRFLARAVALVVVALSFNFFLPIRAELDPVINEGDPVCESLVEAGVAIYSNGAVGCDALAYNLRREQYQKPPVTERQAPFSAQLQNYLQYFDWQWSRGVDPSGQLGTARLPFTLLFMGLGLLGLWTAFRADRVVFGYLITLTLTLTLGLVYYLNFKYGFSLAPEVTSLELHEVRERDYFFVASFILWGTLAGVGLAFSWGALAHMTRNARPYRVASPVLVLALLPLVLNWPWASRAGDFAARDWAYDLLMSVEPYAILFTNGDNDTFPLWYLQEVEGVRKDVTVIVGQYLYTPWYPKQLQRLTTPERQRPYDPDSSGDLYPAPELPPSESIIDLTPAQMDRVVSALLDRDLTVPFGPLAVSYPAGMGLDRGDQLALNIIHDSWDERPIYFSSSAGMLTDLGFERWGVRHGLVTKLEFRSLEGDQPEGFVQGSEGYGSTWTDLEHSLRLYDEVYQYRSIRDRPIWQDRSTLNIPWSYYVMAALMADAANQAGADPALVERLAAEADGFRAVAEGGARAPVDR